MGPKYALLWPKDPRPGNPSSWPRSWRLKDVLTGKGPDMYVERIDGRSNEYDFPEIHGRRRSCPHKPPIISLTYDRETGRRVPTILREPKELGVGNGDRPFRRTGWSLWEKDHLKTCLVRRCHECLQIRIQEERDNAFGARRGPAERYDFRTRKYVVPDIDCWSWKVYCNDSAHIVPREYRDYLGRRYPSSYIHDLIHGPHEDRHPRYRNRGTTSV